MQPYARLWSLRTAMQLSLGPMHKAPRCGTQLAPLKSVLKTRRRDLVRWKAKIELRSMRPKIFGIFVSYKVLHVFCLNECPKFILFYLG